MPFRLLALERDEFAPFFEKDDESLAAIGVQRMQVDAEPGYPCRISLQDARVGETVLLMNYEHQPASTPYRSSHAIFVREAAREARPDPDTVPDMLRRRLISARAFDTDHMMVAADIVDGEHLAALIEGMLANDSTDYVHLHNAQRGCYLACAARV